MHQLPPHGIAWTSRATSALLITSSREAWTLYRAVTRGSDAADPHGPQGATAQQGRALHLNETPGPKIGSEMRGHSGVSTHVLLSRGGKVHPGWDTWQTDDRVGGTPSRGGSSCSVSSPDLHPERKNVRSAVRSIMRGARAWTGRDGCGWGHGARRWIPVGPKRAAVVRGRSPLPPSTIYAMKQRMYRDLRAVRSVGNRSDLGNVPCIDVRAAPPVTPWTDLTQPCVSLAPFRNQTWRPEAIPWRYPWRSSLQSMRSYDTIYPRRYRSPCSRITYVCLFHFLCDRTLPTLSKRCFSCSCS